MKCGYCQDSFQKLKKLLSHWKETSCPVSGWKKVIELKKEGQYESADKLARKLMGVHMEMSEEAKQKLKEYYEAHKEEIQERQKLKRMQKKVLQERIQSLQNSGKKVKRKRL